LIILGSSKLRDTAAHASPSIVLMQRLLHPSAKQSWAQQRSQ